ncbi:hypothetical protein EU537_00195 [Candidatus Thorarchaeota archaeon]|nr:MAG: hypothetical protein EU537_00195 [Candidatus Thorarchaeota archaeon]
MKKKISHKLLILTMSVLFWSMVLMPANAQPPGWSGDENLAFLLKVNDISAAYSNSSNPIPVNISTPIDLELTLDVQNNMTLHSGAFSMEYLGIPIFGQSFDIDQIVPAGITVPVLNESMDLSSLSGPQGIDLFSGSIVGTFTFNYSLLTSPDEHAQVEENFVLRVGPQGVAAVTSLNGLLTVGFTVMGVFSLLLSLDNFQGAILSARKVRGAKSASDVGIFPKELVLRRSPKKSEAEKISKEELIRRTRNAATDFSDEIAEYAPKALRAVPPKSKVPVGKFAKRVGLRPDKAGALAAALTTLGIFHTKSMKVPLMKVAFAGMTLSAMYYSWQQLFYGATPSLIDMLLLTTAGLVVSVLFAYFMNWLSRIPELGSG